MESEYNILKQITPDNKSPYLIPFGYFDGLAATILLKINGKQDTYCVPNNYFNNLPTDILTKVKLQNELHNEIQEIAPLLSKINKKDVYNVPLDYFDKTVFAPINHPKVVSIKNRKLILIKYTVAAVLIGIVSFVGISLLNRPASIENDLQASIQNISDSDLKNELENDKISNISTDENVLIAPWQNITDLQEEIKYIPDTDIEVYLNDNIIIDETTISSNS